MIYDDCIVDTLHDAGIVTWWLNTKWTICMLQLIMMIILQMCNLHVTGMSTCCLYYLHYCMLQMWVHDDGIICTIACNGIRAMIFLIVIVNPEYHIIVLIAHDSVFAVLFSFLLSYFAFLHLRLMVSQFAILLQLQLQALTLYLDWSFNLHRGPTYL